MAFRSHRIPGFRLGAALAAVALVAAACGGSSSGGAAQGGVFRLGSASSIDSLNPFVAFQEDAYSSFEYIYPYLVQYNRSLQFVPDFARSWSESGGGRVWTFHTQPNAKWSDGKPLTAADAAWTFSTIIKFQNGPTANAAGDVAHMKSATAPNATTLVLTYKQPVANVLSQLQQVPILPEHVWAKYATGQRQGADHVHQPGPDRLRRPVHPGQVHAEAGRAVQAQPNFYGPKPHIDGLGLQFFGTNDARDHRAEERPAGRDRGGAADLGGRPEARPASWYGRARATTSTTSSSTPTRPAGRATRNCSTRCCGRRSTTRSTGTQIVKTSLLGYGQPGSSIIPPATGHWYDPAIKPARVQPGQGRTRCWTRRASRWAATASGSRTGTRCPTR